MKQLRISYLELRNLQIPPVWSISSNSYFDFWIKEKLRKVGFNLTKEYRSYKDLETLDLIFEQKEKDDNE